MSSTKQVATENPPARSYTVLYYKRKNKVHKSKGVSKMDGSLSVDHPPKSVVTLSEGPNQKVIFRGIQRQIASQDLQVDDVVQIGAYEVEILSIEHDRAPQKKAASNGTANAGPKLATRPPPKLQTFKRNVFRPDASRKPSTTLPKRIGYKCAQPKKKAQPQNEPIHALSDNESSSDDDDDQRKIVVPQPLHAQSTIPAKGLASRKRSITPSRTPFLASKHPRSAFTRLGPKGTQPVRSTATTISPTEIRSVQPLQATASTFFPGAVGNLDVPHSIKNVLKHHQIEGVAFLWNCLTGNTKASEVSPHSERDVTYKGSILADEMGLGKTLMTIAVTCALHRKNRSMRFVVVCPSSLVVNWEKEFDKWIGKASNPKRVVVKKGGEEGLSRLKAFCAVKSGQAEVLIISYDLFRMNSALFEHVKKIALLVVDEGHRLKNTAGSLTLTALKSIPCEARLCITATPIQNNLSDFFNIANFVCPGLLGDLNTFRKEYERPISAMNNKSCSTEQMRRGKQQSRLLDTITKTFMIRRLQKDILKVLLPPRTEALVFCRPTKVQCQLYQEITSQQRIDYGVTADALTTLINLRKLCSHPSLLDAATVESSQSNSKSSIDCSGKLKTLDFLLNQIRKQAPDDKIVIVSNFTSALSMIETTILKPRGLSFVRLDGTTEVSKRQQVVDTFNRTSSARSFAFLLSSKAGGCGLNLIGANRLVMFDPDWNPASDIQAMARVYRQGQKKPCTIYRLFTSGTVEEVICQRQIQKGNLATIAVDSAGKKSNSKKGGEGFTKEELRDCFTLKEGCDCDTKVKIGDKWPAYAGVSSIESQGCEDKPLLATASWQASPISFIHIVQNVDEPALSSDESPNSEDLLCGDEDQSSDEENEWSDSSNAERMSDSSDDENEF